MPDGSRLEGVEPALDPLCAAHPHARATGTCARCGDNVCARCVDPSARGQAAGACAACRRKLGKDTIEPWQGAIALVVGGIAAQLAGASVFVVGVFWLVANGQAADPVAMQETLLGSFWVLGPSIFLTGLTMFLVGVATPWLAKARLKTALGLRGAPWPVFIAAPLGIVALGPTSDLARTLMVEYLPTWTLGSLDSLNEVARSAPLWAIVPAMAFVPGIAEETLFRGMFQRSIRAPLLALVLSAVLFAAYHMDPHHVAAVLPLGFYLAWLGQRTGSLYVPIVAHIVNNTAAVVGSRYLPENQPSILEEWWYVPIGWLIAAGCVGVIVYATRRRAAVVEPALEPALAPLPGE